MYIYLPINRSFHLIHRNQQFHIVAVMVDLSECRWLLPANNKTSGYGYLQIVYEFLYNFKVYYRQ